MHRPHKANPSTYHRMPSGKDCAFRFVRSALFFYNLTRLLQNSKSFVTASFQLSPFVIIIHEIILLFVIMVTYDS